MLLFLLGCINRKLRSGLLWACACGDGAASRGEKRLSGLSEICPTSGEREKAAQATYQSKSRNRTLACR